IISSNNFEIAKPTMEASSNQPSIGITSGIASKGEITYIIVPIIIDILHGFILYFPEIVSFIIEIIKLKSEALLPKFGDICCAKEISSLVIFRFLKVLNNNFALLK